MNEPKRRRRWLPWLFGLGVLALLGWGASVAMLANWSDLRVAPQAEAHEVFQARLKGPASGLPYLTVDAEGNVHVDRSLEIDPEDLEVLVVLAWEPENERLLETRLPWWFVKMKSTRHFNLGTAVTFVAKDWDHLNLSVTEDDLEARGPGLVLDVTREDGARLLLWTE
ncbi:MAG: hypothetical protein O2816_00820 [Planctomycetota bacterium]|nr:hypothetical protein [Planctomycetota bacterium]